MKIWKNKASRIWLIVAAAVIALLITATILVSTTFFSAVCLVFGKPRLILTGEETSAFNKDFSTKEESFANGNKVAKEICEEGFTLLKNNSKTLPLNKNETAVSVFGKNSVNMAIGGSGSGGSEGQDSVSIFESLTSSGFTYNTQLTDFYKDEAKSGPPRKPNTKDLDTGSALGLTEEFVGEAPMGLYDTHNIWKTCDGYKDAALIIITRIGGEGFDLPRSANDHILKLRPNEKELISKVKTLGFGKVILVLNTPATLELMDVNEDDGVDAILWIGFAGGNGLSAFGEILKGETKEGVKFSPSGKTVDTYAADFTHSPAWENMGAALDGDAYTIDGGRTGQVPQQAYFVDYEESIYVGYRFYETAHAEALKGNSAIGGYNFDYDAEVVYPFGYGLSYTEFEWELKNEAEVKDKVMTEDTSLTFKMEVTNTGIHPGRDVVQLYVIPPYKNGIEKSAKILVGFGKTGLLASGEKGMVEITVDSPYEFASYDYNDANTNEFKGYEVEKGNYTFTLSTDAHNSVIEVAASVENDIKYEKDPATGTIVVNQYTGQANDRMNSDTELGSLLSRAKWTDSWPARRTADEKKVGTRLEWLDYIMNTKGNPDPNRPVKDDKMPDTEKNNGIILPELVGVNYSDGLWDEFLDQLTVNEMSNLANDGAFKTVDIERLGVPQSIAADGPVGFCNFLSDPSVYGTCVYPCQVVLASTWSVDRLYDMGVALGNEALVGDLKNGGTPYTGWYAPGINLHRTPFGGRNFEYYSEDPFLSGKLAAAIMKGASTKGVYTDMKHFALNDQETHRNGVLTWASEQSIREVYLKAFEIAIKTAKSDGVKSMGLMSSFNRIGERWTGGDYRLLTTILRSEWGFEGLVICDFNAALPVIAKDMFYAGGSLNLTLLNSRKYTPNAGDATDVTIFRQAAKDILYTIANSNAMRGDFRMAMPVWQITFIIIDCVVLAGLIVWGFFVVRKALKQG